MADEEPDTSMVDQEGLYKSQSTQFSVCADCCAVTRKISPGFSLSLGTGMVNTELYFFWCACAMATLVRCSRAKIQTMQGSKLKKLFGD